MALRSTAHSRLVLMGLAVAGVVAGSAGTASAQYYYGRYYEDEYEAYAPRYYERYAPPAPIQVQPRTVARLAVRNYGLAQVDRTVRTQSSYIIDGLTAEGRPTRLIIDRYSGDLVDRIALPGARREAPHVARIDPRDEERPAPRIVRRPPERPSSLKPPTEASAPATQPLPSPAAPPHAAEPVKPAEPQPPATANAPATIAPASPAAPPTPTPGAADPATGAAKPQLVNPSDVRGTSDAEREPPLARADQPAPARELGALPPVQLDDATPAAPRPQTPIVPAAPLD
jgi:hypothetical protein